MNQDKLYYRVLRYIKRHLLKVFISIIKIIPKNNNRWVFGSRFGERYDENSKYLYEYVSEHHHHIQTIWITSNNIVYEHLKKNKFTVYYSGSIQGWYYSLTASVAFISVCYRDINRFSICGAKIVQLWHGTPMRNNNIAELQENYEMVTVSSEEYLKNGFLGDPDLFDFVLTGYPKNDKMRAIQKSSRVEKILSKYGKKNTIIYLPTHRQRHDDNGNIKRIEEFDLFEYEFDINLLERTMDKLDALFILKLHPLQNINDSKVLDKINNSKSIHMVDSINPLEDVYEYLNFADILVTDYSSVYFDYLLLNRPVIFAIFDYESQLNLREFRFNIDEIFTGEKVFTWSEVLDSISYILLEGDRWFESRSIVNNRFNYHRDSCSSERVYKEVKRRLSL
jgi:CDP-glycerol glycerophosphotransferase (TagB/SpsB family)